MNIQKQETKMQNNIKTQIKAFSLIEILVGLIIISVTLAAFAPVVNKKVKAQTSAINTKLTEKCTKFSSYCSLCQGTKYCVQCNRGCNVDQKLNVSTCSCQNNI